VAPLKLTVPWLELSPTTTDELNLNEASEAGVIWTAADRDFPLKFTVIVADVDVSTGSVLTENAPSIPCCPEKSIEFGTGAAQLLLVIATIEPSAPVKPLKISVAKQLLPPKIELVDNVNDQRLGGMIVRVAALRPLPMPAVIVTGVEVLTGDAAAAKVTVVAPAGTVTVSGTETMGLLDVRVTTPPPEGAGFERVTVPVDDHPPR